MLDWSYSYKHWRRKRNISADNCLDGSENMSDLSHKSKPLVHAVVESN